MLAKHSIPISEVLGMGIGAVGPVDRLSGVIVEPSYFPANGWRNVEICSWLSREFAAANHARQWGEHSDIG